MLKIAIIEDNPMHLGRMEEAIAKAHHDHHLVVHTTAVMNRQDYQQMITPESLYDVYFIDLELEGNRDMGFQWAQEIRTYQPYAALVFVTTLSESMPLAFKNHVSALDFITKDSDPSEFEQRVAHCLLDVANERTNIDPQDMLTYRYKEHNGIHVPFKDVLFIETAGTSHRLLLYTYSLRKEFYGVLNDILALDTTHDLIKVSRYAIVNTNNVVMIKR
ncbi:MAG: LytTR family DNA-binding domain-containing protein [Aerococcus sp.]|nr:LytTR family DNA-binding domain-containing protein [Aerococcus sp.]